MGPSDWIFPETIEDALAALSKPGAQAIAGGTTVMDLMKLGHTTGTSYVDLSRLDLKHIRHMNGTTVIGGLASNTAVAEASLIRTHHRALSEAILLGASQQIRNAATLGGNLLQATRCSYFRAPDWPCNRRVPGSGCAAVDAPGNGHAILGTSAQCIATHPSDMAVALLALDATVVCVDVNGAHRLPISQFFALPGESPHVETLLPAGALLTEVELPQDPLFRTSGYVKLRGRASYEFASASAAVAVEVADGVLNRVAIALGGVGSVPWRDLDAEQILVGHRPDRDRIDLFCDRLLGAAERRPQTQHKIPLVRGAVHHMLSRLVEQ
tara:strand:+ start:1272 stop:2249 length:978 start_codon:yes stop_codon:yes gene_type:complete